MPPSGLSPSLPHEDPWPESGDIVVAPGVVISGAALTYSFVSSSGPGGQNVNKKATKCTLRVSLESLPLHADQLARLCRIASRYLTDDNELVISADEHRSQPRNKGECADKLRIMVLECLKPPKIRKATKPSRSQKERRIRDKKLNSSRKRDRRPDGE